MAAKLSELLEKKFILVTGKGGAGKSHLALALAHRLSLLGKKVWLVEMGRRKDHSFTRLPELVGLDQASHKPVNVVLPGSDEKVAVSVLDPTQSLAEYVSLKLPGGGLAGLLLNNRVTASFLEVVPGLPDLVSLGKLWFSLEHPHPDRGPDVVVLDGPATGHAIALLKAPANFKRITRVGPIYKDAVQMAEFFSDPKQTGIALATLPEEMALQETAELKKILAKDFPAPFVFVNRCFPELDPLEEAKDTVPYKAYEYVRKRGQREKEASSGLPWKLPFFFPDPSQGPLYLRMSEALP